MKCFYHNENDAVGICKHCGKGVCTDCAIDQGYGVACKDKHEDEVKNIHNLIENSKKTYQAQPKATLFAPVFLMGMGAVFFYFGIKKGFDSFTAILGIGFMVFGFSTLVYNRLFISKLKTSNEQ